MTPKRRCSVFSLIFIVNCISKFNLIRISKLSSQYSVVSSTPFKPCITCENCLSYLKSGKFYLIETGFGKFIFFYSSSEDISLWLRNLMDTCSATLRAPLVGTGGRTCRSLGTMWFLIHLVRKVRWLV